MTLLYELSRYDSIQKFSYIKKIVLILGETLNIQCNLTGYEFDKKLHLSDIASRSLRIYDVYILNRTDLKWVSSMVVTFLYQSILCHGHCRFMMGRHMRQQKYKTASYCYCHLHHDLTWHIFLNSPTWNSFYVTDIICDDHLREFWIISHIKLLRFTSNLFYESSNFNRIFNKN